MIYVPLRHLKPKMVLARDITVGTTVFPLVAAGQVLTVQTIQKLTQKNIRGVYIKSKFCEDVELNELIAPEFKDRMISELKVFYSNYRNNSAFSTKSFKMLSDTVDALVKHILTQGECFINIIDIKDYDMYTYTHSMYVCILSVLIGVQNGLNHSALNELAMCGLLHDLGKLDIPLSIINKKDILTNDEFEVMKSHPYKAITRLRPCCQISSNVLSGILSHHEKFDGTGYPNRLSGLNIPLYGRILALADVYDALTSERSYRRAWASCDAIEYMMGCADTHFDFDLLKSFLKTVAAYPVGMIVKLSNGALGVVIQNSPENILRPKVRLLGPKEHLGKIVDLADPDGLFLNLTIIGTADDGTAIPDDIFV